MTEEFDRFVEQVKVEAEKDRQLVELVDGRDGAKAYTISEMME